MAKTKNEKDIDKMYRDLLDSSDSRRHESGSLLRFFVGLLMLAGGLFMILHNIRVTSSWGAGGYFYSIGSFRLSNGMIMLPAIIGIAMLFLMDKKIFGWIVLAIGIVIILLSVLMTTRISWTPTNGYMMIIMFGLTAAGAGMVLRELFRGK